ncbi:MAG: hypothetical protein K6G50_05755 [bacterium]|nr:hypothetical protein [bacterium]
MDTSAWIETLGYAGTAIVLLSFTMKSVVRLRIINSIGDLLTVIYALLITAFPTALMNGSLILINIWFLAKEMIHKSSYDIVESSSSDKMLAYFLKKHEPDIRRYFPDFNFRAEAIDFARFIFTENGENAVGLLLGKRSGNELELVLDYSVPHYRDCSVGRFAYEQFAQEGIEKVFIKGDQSKSRAYLKRIGFTAAEGVYSKVLLPGAAG